MLKLFCNIGPRSLKLAFSLPLSLKSVDSVVSFKKQLKAHLFKLAYR